MLSIIYIYICIYIYNCKLINPCNAYNINQDSGAWVLIFEGFWVLTWVFEWCRIHIKTVFAQHPHPFPPRFSQEIPETPQNRRKPPISWENLGEPGRTWRTWEDLGGNSWELGISQAGLGELQKLVRGKVAGGWPAILTHNF